MEQISSKKLCSELCLQQQQLYLKWSKVKRGLDVVTPHLESMTGVQPIGKRKGETCSIHKPVVDHHLDSTT